MNLLNIRRLPYQVIFRKWVNQSQYRQKMILLSLLSFSKKGKLSFVSVKKPKILLSFQTYEFSRKTWKYCDCLTECAEECRIIKSEGKLYAHFFCSECETFSVRYFKEKDECFTCPVKLCTKLMSFDEFKERSCCFDAKFGDIKVILIKKFGNFMNLTNSNNKFRNWLLKQSKALSLTFRSESMNQKTSLRSKSHKNIKYIAIPS